MSKIIEVFQNVEIIKGIIDTLLMVSCSAIISYLIGLPLGILVVGTKENGLFPCVIINKILGVIINIGRSVPFIILLVVLIPFTRFISGTSIGVRGMIVPLSIGAVFLVARMVESSLEEISSGKIDASRCMGFNNFQIITKVYLVESFPSLIKGFAIITITLVGYSAMSGAVGGGGLGNIAIEYGYYHFDTITMLVVLVILIFIVQVIQILFDLMAKKVDHRKKI